MEIDDNEEEVDNKENVKDEPDETKEALAKLSNEILSLWQRRTSHQQQSIALLSQCTSNKLSNYPAMELVLSRQPKKILGGPKSIYEVQILHGLIQFWEENKKYNCDNWSSL